MPKRAFTSAKVRNLTRPSARCSWAWSCPDVEQLVHACLADEVADDPPEDRPLRLDSGLDLRERGDDLIAERAVGGGALFAAEQVVVQPGHVGPRRVNGAAGSLILGRKLLALGNQLRHTRPFVAIRGIVSAHLTRWRGILGRCRGT